ncbi:hypothetical protein MMC16_004852 [Acarospora aff. strigata]|nr:hypothetical protein [Acarospora aff. strigata]
MRRGTTSDFVAYNYPELTNTRCLPYPRSSPTSKRNLKITPSTAAPPPPPFVLTGHPTTGPPEGTYGAYLPPSLPPTSTRKRKVSDLNNPFAPPSAASSSAYPDPGNLGEVIGAPVEPTSATQSTKKSRTNTPWSPAEEQRLKTMRDAGSSWSEIAKDMHYAEFAEDESAALLAAIKEYEASKWKVIGQKVGKPAKACEQYAREHFGGKV